MEMDTLRHKKTLSPCKIMGNVVSNRSSYLLNHYHFNELANLTWSGQQMDKWSFNWQSLPCLFFFPLQDDNLLNEQYVSGCILLQGHS